jgi:flagellar hook-associated protein 3 FlgL
MLRIASFSQQQSLVGGLLRNQNELFVAQQQVNSGKKAQDYEGYANQTVTLVSARSLKSQSESFQRATQAVDQALQTNDLQLGTIIEATRGLRETVLNSLSQNDGVGIKQAMEHALSVGISVVNTKVGGKFVFGGSKTATAPTAVASLNDLVGLTDIQDAFVNDDFKARAQVAETIDMPYGLLANEVAAGLFEALQQLEIYSQGPDGPLAPGGLTDAQRTFLQGIVTDLENSAIDVQAMQVSNGLQQERLEEIKGQLVSRTNYLTTFIADIEDVDIAEAVSRLQSEQAAIETSYRVIGNLSQLSLNNFL